MPWLWLVPAILASLWSWRCMFRWMWSGFFSPNCNDLFISLVFATVGFWMAPFILAREGLRRHHRQTNVKAIGDVIAGRSIFDRLQEKRRELHD